MNPPYIPGSNLAPQQSYPNIRQTPSVTFSGVTPFVSKIGTTRNVTPNITAKINRPTNEQQLQQVYQNSALSSLANPTVKVETTKAERDRSLIETAQKEGKLQLLTIVKSSITLYSWEEMERIAGNIRITNKNYSGDGSINDPRMGIASLNNSCSYCGQVDCPGHYGLIEFGTSIYNPIFIRSVISVLTCVCNSCGGLLITEDVMREKGFMKLSPVKRLSKMEAHCRGAPCLRKKEQKQCPSNQRQRGAIISCTRNPIFETKDIRKKGDITYKMVEEQQGKGGAKKKSADVDSKIHPMSITEVMNILDCISLEDSALLGFPSYHRRLTKQNVIKVLTRSKEEDLNTFKLNAVNVVFTDRPFEEILAILNSLPEASLKRLGFSPYRRIRYENDVFNILSKTRPEYLYAAGLNTPTALFSNRSFNEIFGILNSLPEDWLIGLGFSYSHRTLTQGEILDVLKTSPFEELSLSGLNAPKITFLTRPYEGVLSILNKLPENALSKLGFLQGSHPRNMIMKGMLVPPPIARPPIYEGGFVHHDQLTIMYINIIQKVANVAAGKPDTVSDLYSTVRQLIFGLDDKKMRTREFLSIVERIQGKDALLRGLLMGKRNNYFGRTVAGPDPSLKFGQIRLPEIWAKILTKPERVTYFNIERLRKLAKEGKITHVTPAVTGLRRYYDSKSTYVLRIGDKVERWLQNGDRVVVNRQPTLHRQSMMSYEVVLSSELTIGLHLYYTTPMNCDFDGDENNAWNPQDFEVEAEAELIMHVKHNIMSQEQNRPAMGCVMNSITGAYILTNPTTRIDDDLFTELIGFINPSNKDLSTLYSRLMKYGIHPRSGQAIFSALLPATFYYNSGGVVILEGILVSGRIKKNHVGPSHRSIIQELYKTYGPDRLVDFFTEAPWIIGKWLIERGFSVGLLDMVSLEVDKETGEERNNNEGIVKDELANIYFQLEALGGKINDPQEEAFRQRKINNLVSVAQGVGLRLAKEVLSGDNSLGIMTDQGAGTKGSLANVGQLFGIIGQQYYHSERLKPTITGGRRLLPTYDVDDNNPEANAFIPRSFYTGLEPEELFFLQAGGREGLLDTATKTSETGSMQHRMIKAFENIIVGNDYSVRNTIGTMFSPIYNSGYDIGEMIKVDVPGRSDFSSFIDLEALTSELNIKRGWVKENIKDKIQQNKRVFINEPLPQTGIIENEEIDYDETPLVTDTRITYKVTDPIILEPPRIKITKYEKSRIIGTRAKQLSNNAPIIIPDIGKETDVIKIALMEYATGNLPIYIIRRFPDGTHRNIYPTLDNI